MNNHYPEQIWFKKQPLSIISKRTSQKSQQITLSLQNPLNSFHFPNQNPIFIFHKEILV